jgi:hypothetical protein
VDEELVPDIYRLVNEIERGQRVVQPGCATATRSIATAGPQHPLG